MANIVRSAAAAAAAAPAPSARLTAGPAAAATAAVTLVRPARARRRPLPLRVPRLARRIIGPLAVLGLWQLVCSQQVFTSVEVASPVAVADAGRQLGPRGCCSPTC